ncbi:D-amino acid dehydrogenase [Mesorhizobium sp. M7A.F.Ca.US.006.01.1.1]|uniref:D-amino acid dehydrogenase n=1 Tax=Mesorhizobium sp. M7A.F.Ca.US.006.01.1.1 TaxID=2496707 RepID=UPI000FCB2AB8|nr:D-amino acid dehydrogenase [Mesorhizobium sp. M7A.F.Ca.US.006.01.1.1]RUZ75999.1 D-amino acid dehydrogenase [Mesorhizobium sp. M7A.F.Ca.US.006.01.1.1]
MKTIVLGGGIIGVTTAYFLAKGGDDVTVVERHSSVAMDTSFANAGLVAPGHSYTWASPSAPGVLIRSLFRDGEALRLKLIPDWRMYAWGLRFLRNCTAARAQRNTSRKVRLSLYSQSQLQAVTREEKLDYSRISKGLLYLFRDQAAFDRGVRNSTILTDNGLPLEVLDRQTTIGKEPALAASGETLVGSIYCPTDETGDAHAFTKAIYDRCIGLGVKFLFDTAIKQVVASGDTVESVDTSKGCLAAQRFVIALGPYTPVVARTIGYNLPIYPVKGYSMTLPIAKEHEAPEIGGIDENNLIAWARFGDRLRFTATAEFAGFDTRHSQSDFAPMIKAARELYPNGADFTQPSYWAGLRPMTATGTPILGRSRHSNLFFNAGHGHLGWTWSCGTSRIVADIMQGRRPEIDMSGLTIG